MKAHLGRITEDTPEHQGVVVFNMADVPLVSQVSASSSGARSVGGKSKESLEWCGKNIIEMGEASGVEIQRTGEGRKDVMAHKETVYVRKELINRVSEQQHVQLSILES